MTYQSLYRKYRPQNFDDVIGQESIVTALTNAVLKDKISHAFLFTGPRGTGKTTTAKLLAKAINCENEEKVICGVCSSCVQATKNTHPDIVEIDAASNNGVEEIRNLIERVKFMPIEGRYKVYIIDEIHMLSQGAFNALLKTLEEPPEHVVFILATTEIHKVLPTIISRCQRFDFARIQNKQIADRLEKIMVLEHRTMEPHASDLIASLSGGGMRNALTILEQAMIFNEGEITVRSIYDNNGMVLPEEKVNLFESLKNQDITQLLQSLETIMEKTVDVARFVMELISGLKDSLVYAYTKNDQYINMNDKVFIEYIKNDYDNKDIVEMINLLLDYHEKIRFSATPFVHFEIAMIELYEKTEKGTSTQRNASVEEEVYYEDKQDEVFEDASFEEEIIEDAFEVETFEEEPFISDEEVESVVEQVIEKPEPQLETKVEPTVAVETETVKPQTQVDLFAQDTMKPLKLDLSIDEIVQYMVSADKEIRIQDEALFPNLKDYLSNPRWAKESNLLNNSQIAASGASFIMVVTKNQAQSRAILDELNLYDLISFTENLLGKPKQVFGITESQYKHAVETFKDLASKNSLPDPLSPEDFITGQDDYVDEKEQVMIDLFGDILEIKE